MILYTLSNLALILSILLVLKPEWLLNKYDLYLAPYLKKIFDDDQQKLIRKVFIYMPVGMVAYFNYLSPLEYSWENLGVQKVMPMTLFKHVVDILGLFAVVVLNAQALGYKQSERMDKLLKNTSVLQLLVWVSTAVLTDKPKRSLIAALVYFSINA